MAFEKGDELIRNGETVTFVEMSETPLPADSSFQPPGGHGVSGYPGPVPTAVVRKADGTTSLVRLSELKKPN